MALLLALMWARGPIALKHGKPVELTIEKGQSAQQIARAWVEAGFDTSAMALNLLFRISGKARYIQASSYVLNQPTSPWQLLNKMQKGEGTLQKFRIIEGWTFRQVRAALQNATGLTQTIAALSDEQVMHAIGADATNPEGWFMPDTYLYAVGVRDVTVLQQAHRAMQRQLTQIWQSKNADIPLKSPYEALILASIIEKETALTADQGLIAGVFSNRLRIGMPLQTDPTVIYGLGEQFDGNLRKHHLQTDTPHNTYTRLGLPPTPIAMPGVAALKSAVQPTPTQALYFVAKGDGSSAFSQTLEQHNRAVQKYQIQRHQLSSTP